MLDSSNFLDQDFTESYNQLRHYDTNIVDSFKFIFTAYISMIGAVVTLLSIETQTNLLMLIKTLLCFTAVFGFFILWYIIELRRYYVKTCRYINEIRNANLTNLSADFKNQTKYYINFKTPPYFSWASSHILLILVISLFNSITLGILTHVCKIWPVIMDICVVVAFLTVHVFFAYSILIKAEKNGLKDGTL